MRHWRRSERRFEIALIIGPVAPTVISRAPVLSVLGLRSVVDDSLLLLLFTISYPNEQTKYVENVLVRQYETLLPAHTRQWFVRPSVVLRTFGRQKVPCYDTSGAMPDRLRPYTMLLP